MLHPTITDLGDNDCHPQIKQFVRGTLDFAIKSYIKRGVNGKVYFGERIKLGDPVVLKFYHGKLGFEESEEAVKLRRVDHENVLTIYDLRFVPPAFPCIISPFISGGDLQGYMDSNIVNSHDALRITAGILQGLSNLHSENQLVHRDLKPGNILIDKDTLHPYIADLGSVKKIPDANGFATPSKATPLYLPPEAIIDKEYRIQSDLYQVGIILFQLLGGFFPLDTPEDWLSGREKSKLNKISDPKQKSIEFYHIIVKKIERGKIADPKTLPGYLGSKVLRLVRKSIHLDYQKRFQTAPELLQAIHELLRTTPCYEKNSDYVLVSHSTGKEYKVFQDLRKQDWLIEKRINRGSWRKDNSHNGSIDQVLKIAKKP